MCSSTSGAHLVHIWCTYRCAQAHTDVHEHIWCTYTVCNMCTICAPYVLQHILMCTNASGTHLNVLEHIWCISGAHMVHIEMCTSTHGARIPFAICAPYVLHMCSSTS